MKVIKHWNNLPWECGGFSITGNFKINTSFFFATYVLSKHELIQGSLMSCVIQKIAREVRSSFWHYNLYFLTLGWSLPPFPPPFYLFIYKSFNILTWMTKHISQYCFWLEYKKMIIFFLLGQACVFHLQVLNMSLSSFILVLAMVCLIILSLFFFSCCSGSCSSPEGSVMASLVLLSKTVTTVSSGPAASWHHITHPLSQCILLTVRAVRPCTNGLWGTIPPFQ